MTVSFTALRDRFQQDRVSEGSGRHDLVASRLEQALDAIGWRSAGGSSSEEVASIAVHVLDECVNRHQDVTRATKAIADLLYTSAATLDGSMHSASAFLPAADEVLQ
ncbi:MAG: hypothetical protein ABI969_18525, partial [bacterium]